MQAQASTITASRSVKPATVLIALVVAALLAVGAIALTRMGGTTAATAAMIGPSEAGSTVAIQVGGELTITLPTNPSTGYGWVVSSIDPASVTQIGEPEFTAESNLIGAGGTMTFRFAGAAAGQSDLQLDYLRPWEDAEPLNTYIVTVTVR